ncbi:MAG: hypothetical protein AB7S41_16265 [Parvibaculaceae bacterium]
MISSAEKSDERIIVADDREPWLELLFGLHDARVVRQDDKEFFTCSLSRQTAGGHMGLAVQMLLSGWEKVNTDDERVTYRYGDLMLLADGEATENLVGYIEQQLGLPRGARGTFTRMLVDYVALNSDPQEIESQPFFGKMFLGEEGDPNEAQLFLSFNVPAGNAWFGLKDLAYSGSIAYWFRKAS